MRDKVVEIGCAQHHGRRSNQEDSFAFSDISDKRFLKHGGIVAILADGMGGHEHGEMASGLAVKTFLHTYTAKLPAQGIPATLERALRASESEVTKLARKKGSDIGTTLTAVVVHDDRLYWASVGDSALYLLRDGELSLINQHHTKLQDLYRDVIDGNLTLSQAREDTYKDALTSCIGGLNGFDISHSPIRVEGGDTIIVCSDGLYNTLDAKEIIAIASDDKGSANDMAKALVSETIKQDNPNQDNVTVLVIKVLGKRRQWVKSPVSMPFSSRSGKYAKPSQRGKSWIIMLGLPLFFLLLLIWMYLNIGLLLPDKDVKKGDTRKVEEGSQQPTDSKKSEKTDTGEGSNIDIKGKPTEGDAKKEERQDTEAVDKKRHSEDNPKTDDGDKPVGVDSKGG